MANKFFFRGIITDLALGLGIALIFTGGILFFSGQEKPVIVNESKLYTVDLGGDINRVELELDYDGFTADSTPLTSVGKKSMIIPRGASGIEVAHLLAENEIIKAEEFLKLNILFGFEKRIKAGKYTFTTEDGVSEVLAKIILKEVKKGD